MKTRSSDDSFEWQSNYFSLIDTISCAVRYDEWNPTEFVDTNDRTYMLPQVFLSSRYLGHASDFTIDRLDRDKPTIYQVLLEDESHVEIPDYFYLNNSIKSKQLWCLLEFSTNDAIGGLNMKCIAQSETFEDLTYVVKHVHEDLKIDFIDDVAHATGQLDLDDIAQEVLDELATQKGYPVIPFTKANLTQYFIDNKFMVFDKQDDDVLIYRAVLITFSLVPDR